MKKLFTTIGMIAIATLAAQAQKNIDLGFEAIATPTTLEVGDTSWINLTFTNNGPDILTTTDTIFYGLDGSTSVWAFVPTADVPVGESAIAENFLRFYDEFQDTLTADVTTEFCLLLYLQSDITYNTDEGSVPATVTYIDENPENDMSCVTITQKPPVDGGDGGSTSISKYSTLNFGLYPNPANNELYINQELLNSSNISYRIYDVMGRQVLNKDMGKLNAGKHNYSIDLTNLSSGTYSIEIISDAEGKGVAKFSIVK